jgi:hypothetical protein
VPKWANAWSLDARSLGAMRVVLGVILLADLAQRFADLSAHYTDQGILPRSLEARLAGQWSLLDLSGSPVFCAALFGLALIAALCLLSGYRTGWATIACWVLWVSLQNRNPLIRHSGDDVLRLLLFWGAFLPWGASFSVDALQGRKFSSGVSMGSVGFILQVLFFFGFLLDHKLLGTSWVQGRAVAEALSVEQYQRPLGAWLSRQDALLPALTYGTLVGQALVAVLLVLPVRSPWPRLVAVVANAGMMLGFGLSLRLGHFPWTGFALLLAFLPPEMWNWAGVRASQAIEAPSGWLSRVRDTLAAAAIVLVLLWNLGEAGATFVVRGQERELASTTVGAAVRALGLQQRWAMFSPNPQAQDGWFVAAAPTAGGQFVDLLPTLWGEPSRPLTVRLDRPLSIADSLGPRRWAMAFLDLAQDPRSAAVEGLARFLCRKSDVPGVKVIYMRFEHLPGHKSTPVEPRVLATHKC